MYGALWRRLPGGGWAKAGQCLVLAVLAVAVLFLWVFPALAPHLPGGQVTVERPGAGPTTSSPVSPSSPASPSSPSSPGAP